MLKLSDYERDLFDNISPIDFRYLDPRVNKYLSENAFTEYKLKVELALIQAFIKNNKCPSHILQEVQEACSQVTTAEVYEEEKITKHDVRALVNCIQRRVSDEAKPYVHMSATSYDIVDSANAARIKDVTKEIMLPDLFKLEELLIEIALREADTAQVGRTHGQHAVPITFGFAIAGYVSRLGKSIEAIIDREVKISGKFSGAVGAYNASSLFFEDPELFERDVLNELGLGPAEHSTQIVPPEDLIRLICEVVTVSGILANLADDMRNLQRTEIGEVGEEFEQNQVGSSTMPQKRNPVNFENVKSFEKIILPRLTTVFMDQISEHQRDLTNSASSRTNVEIFAYAISDINRMTKTMSKLVVDKDNMTRNLTTHGGFILSEPLYIILASLGHPDAHNKVKKITQHAQLENMTFTEAVLDDFDMVDYLKKMTDHQRNIINDPLKYTGIAATKARKVANHWKEKIAKFKN